MPPQRQPNFAGHSTLSCWGPMDFENSTIVRDRIDRVRWPCALASCFDDPLWELGSDLIAPLPPAMTAQDELVSSL